MPQVDTAIGNAAMAPSYVPQLPPEIHLAAPEVNLGSITLGGVQSTSHALDNVLADPVGLEGPGTTDSTPLKEEIGNLVDPPPRRKSPGNQQGDWRCLYPSGGPSRAGPKGRTPDGGTPPKKEERAVSWRFPGDSLSESRG